MRTRLFAGPIEFREDTLGTEDVARQRERRHAAKPSVFCSEPGVSAPPSKHGFGDGSHHCPVGRMRRAAIHIRESNSSASISSGPLIGMTVGLLEPLS